MDRSIGRKIIFFFLLVVGNSLSAKAAEILLKDECSCPRSIVRLGDVADLHLEDRQESDRLAKLVLFPAPQKNATRVLKIGELRELLTLHDVDLLRYRLSGAKQANIHRALNSSSRPAARTVGFTQEESRPKKRVSAIDYKKTQRAERRLRKTIVEYLKNYIDSKVDWNVQFTIDRSLTELLANAQTKLQLQGGSEPWTGQQIYQLTTASIYGKQQFSIKAQISLPAAVVVATRAIRNGEMIKAADVELQIPKSNSRGGELFQSLEEVIGKEITRSLASGQAVDANSIRGRILVHRRKTVTVIAKTAGIKVQTEARATEDGSLGDLIMLESLDGSKERFPARVTGIQEAEVYVTGVRATDPLDRRSVSNQQPRTYRR